MSRTPRALYASIFIIAILLVVLTLSCSTRFRTRAAAPSDTSAAVESEGVPPSTLPPIPFEVPDYTTTTSVPPPTLVVVTSPSKRHRYPETVTRWHDLALSVGWTEKQWKILQCIINRESRGQLFPPRHNATGLLQILQSGHPGTDLQDPATNLRIGHEMFLSAWWAPWYYPPKPCYGEK